MEVESEDEDDEREVRGEGQPSQPDQDTQVQDMDEVRTDEVIHQLRLVNCPSLTKCRPFYCFIEFTAISLVAFFFMSYFPFPYK